MLVDYICVWISKALTDKAEHERDRLVEEAQLAHDARDKAVQPPQAEDRKQVAAVDDKGVLRHAKHLRRQRLPKCQCQLCIKALTQR